MRVLVTGASGFVGHHVCEHILKNTDWHIVTIDRLAYTARKGYDRLRDVNVYDSNRVTRFTYDLAQPIGEGLAKEIGAVDYIFHLAANSHVDYSISNPLEFISDNIVSNLTMLEYARDLKSLKRFIYFSTDEVYGSAPEGVDYKEGDRHNSGNPYSASKSGAEACCRAYANTYKIPINITNGMNIIGERQDPSKFLPLVMNKVLAGERVFIHGTPDKQQAGKRHYLHARNVGAALLFIVESTNELLDPFDASLGTFNIVGDKEYDNLTFAKMIASYTGKPLDYEIVDFHSSRPGHDLRYSMSGDKLASYGFKFAIPVEKTIENTVKWTLREENMRWLS